MVTQVPATPKRERYISPIPGKKRGFLVRITRLAKPEFATSMADARVKRTRLFKELFGVPYSETAAKRVSYSSNKGSDRRGVEYVQLQNGKCFWQVKYHEPDLSGEKPKLRIKKFFVSKWGHQGGHDAAVIFKDKQERKATSGVKDSA